MEARIARHVAVRRQGISFGWGSSEVRRAALVRSLALAEEAGAGTLRALELEADDGPDPRTREACGRLADDVADGLPLADALERQPGQFAPWEVGLVRAGERGGRLADALSAWARVAQARGRLRSLAASAAIYPLTVLAITVLIVWVILLQVLPTFTALFAMMGQALPASTQVVLVLAHLVASLGPLLVVLAVALAAVAVVERRRRGRSAAWRARLASFVPVFGGFALRLARALAFQVVGAATDAGLSADEALELAGDAQPSELHRRELQAAADSLAAGHDLPCGRRGSALDVRTVRTLTVALASARPGEALAAAARRAETEVDAQLERALAVFEPLTILVLGLFLGLVAIGIWAPILHLPTGVAP